MSDKIERSQADERQADEEVKRMDNKLSSILRQIAFDPVSNGADVIRFYKLASVAYGLEMEVARLREIVSARDVVKDEVLDFDLRHPAVEQLIKVRITIVREQSESPRATEDQP